MSDEENIKNEERLENEKKRPLEAETFMQMIVAPVPVLKFQKTDRKFFGKYPNFEWKLVPNPKRLVKISKPIAEFSHLCRELGVTVTEFGVKGSKRIKLEELNSVYQRMEQRKEAWLTSRKTCDIVEPIPYDVEGLKKKWKVPDEISEMKPIIIGGSSLGEFCGLWTRTAWEVMGKEKGSNDGFIQQVNGDKKLFSYADYVRMAMGSHQETTTAEYLSTNFPHKKYFEVGSRLWRHPRVPIFVFTSPDLVVWNDLTKKWEVAEIKWPSCYNFDEKNQVTRYRCVSPWEYWQHYYLPQIYGEMYAFNALHCDAICSTATKGHAVWGYDFDPAVWNAILDRMEYVYMTYYVKKVPVSEHTNVFSGDPNGYSFLSLIKETIERRAQILPTRYDLSDPCYGEMFFDDDNGNDRRKMDPNLKGVSIEYVEKQLEIQERLAASKLEKQHKLTDFFKKKDVIEIE